MKFRNVISLFCTALFDGFHYRYCPVWDRGLAKLMEEGVLLEVRNGIALFECDSRLYEIFVGMGFQYFGFLISMDAHAIDESARRRASFATMERLKRLVEKENARIAKERESEMQVMMKTLLAE
ncbi:hypothetical protein IAS44_002133 [Salmonella enterica subsp. enterica serovar Anatum]|uniref:hypothetical protein n=1 Tax=Salmonella enterica TaxID=28901 RepID=UPI00078BD0E6|nr:hypothetical protein [Salmonella enterica]ECO0921494.1 hypothetical protein [Salmonella enterica subsp. enterica serovar Infantis]EGC9580489.1 hypothetical protein [Salmonella enterica subsp. enterica serovar Anatum]AMQ09335.1 hypothetical protein AW50_49905 [Salmonella enterica subsp. enterica serovar Anatum str. USDA-ARS-USMARC-1735]EBD6220743.1 hypothetical protein [Salmonella enterica]ECY1901995.1 hypothetical protein [Salmonella enterica]